MINNNYNNGERARLVKEFYARFDRASLITDSELRKTVNISKEDLNIEETPYVRFISCYPQYEACFLPFCANVVSSPAYFDCSNVGDGVQRFTYVRGDNVSYYYTVPFVVMSSFMAANMYSMYPEYEKFDNLIQLNSMQSYYLPSPRNRIDDGQLKIVCDAVLTLDACDVRDDVNILVIGSSHPGLSEGGIAYCAIPLMQFTGEVNLYDKYNEDIVEKFNDSKLVMKYHKQDFDYFDPPDDVDIVLDDAWVEGKYHEDFDPDFFSVNVPNFSVKAFENDLFPNGKSYHQAFMTVGREKRQVSRMRHAYYRELPIGSCGACLEMRFFLKREYPQSFFDFFMKSHKVNCITREKRETFFDHKKVSINDFVSVHKFDLGHHHFFKLKHDHNIGDFENMPGDAVKLRNCNIIASSVDMINSYIMYECPLVLLVGQYRCKCHFIFGCCPNVHIEPFDCCYKDEFWFVSRMTESFSSKSLTTFDKKLKIVEQLSKNAHKSLNSSAGVTKNTKDVINAKRDMIRDNNFEKYVKPISPIMRDGVRKGRIKRRLNSDVLKRY